MRGLYRGFRAGARTLAKAVAGGDPVRDLAATTVIDSVLDLGERPLRRILRGRGLLDGTEVERRYDALAGTYLERLYGPKSSEEGLYVIDGHPRSIAHRAFQEKRMSEYATILRDLEFESVLEVGAGELPTLTGLAAHFPARRWAGVDVSFACLAVGKKHFESATNLPVDVAKATATALPFGDQSFDLVLTSGCLAVMPETYGAAIAEMLRVSRRWVVLLEPTYELGGSVQKLRMRAHGYARGLPSYVRSLPGVNARAPRLLENGAVYTRLAAFVLEKEGTSRTGAGTPDAFACPSCHRPLERHDDVLDCACGRQYEVSGGIARLDLSEAVTP